jgi:predicted site-specific integrase-resolvase
VSTPQQTVGSSRQQHILLYARMDRRADWTEEEHSAHLNREIEALRVAVGFESSHRFMIGCEVGAADDFDRELLSAMINEYVLTRQLSCIVVMNQDRLVPEGAFPLLEWLCAQHQVAIRCAQDVEENAADSMETK